MRLVSEKIIAVKPANTEQYCPTVAGILMFSESPNHLTSRVVEFEDSEGIQV